MFVGCDINKWNGIVSLEELSNEVLLEIWSSIYIFVYITSQYKITNIKSNKNTWIIPTSAENIKNYRKYKSNLNKFEFVINLHGLGFYCNLLLICVKHIFLEIKMREIFQYKIVNIACAVTIPKEYSLKVNGFHTNMDKSITDLCETWGAKTHGKKSYLIIRPK